jgi:hypothetical protein
MKALKEARKAKQRDNADAVGRLRLARNKLASQVFKVNNYNSLASFQKRDVDEMINGDKE